MDSPVKIPNYGGNQDDFILHIPDEYSWTSGYNENELIFYYLLFFARFFLKGLNLQM